QLAGVFSENANTLVLDGTQARALLADGVPLDSAAATDALNRLESAYDYLLFVADPDVSAWTQKAIRHADLVLAVAADDADPVPNDLEKFASEFLNGEAHRLVLVHGRRTPIS